MFSSRVEGRLLRSFAPLTRPCALGAESAVEPPSRLENRVPRIVWGNHGTTARRCRRHPAVVQAGVDVIREGVSHIAGATCLRTPGLDDMAPDDTVKNSTVKERTAWIKG